MQPPVDSHLPVTRVLAMLLISDLVFVSRTSIVATNGEAGSDESLIQAVLTMLNAVFMKDKI